MFGLTATVIIFVSLMTEPIADEHLHRLTFWTRYSDDVRDELDYLDNVDPRQSAGPEGEEEKTPWYTKALIYVFGPDRAVREEDSTLDTLEAEIKTREELAREAALFLKEPYEWKRFLNINAVTVLSLTFFTIGFYAI